MVKFLAVKLLLSFIGIQFTHGSFYFKDSKDVYEYEYEFGSDKNQSLEIRANPEFMILVTVESLNCDPTYSKNKLVLKAYDAVKSQCLNINEEKRKYKPSSFQITGKGQVTVFIETDAQSEEIDLKAKIVASVFRETDKCSQCEKNEFCCNENSACSPFNDDAKKVRCIHKSWKCNLLGRPFCGLSCNPDQTAETCQGYYFGFVWSSVLFFIAFLSVPAFVVILFCCYRKSLRDRINTASRSNQSRSGNIYPTNDFPPNYADVTGEKPPSFAAATTMTVHSQRAA